MIDTEPCPQAAYNPLLRTPLFPKVSLLLFIALPLFAVNFTMGAIFDKTAGCFLNIIYVKMGFEMKRGI